MVAPVRCSCGEAEPHVIMARCTFDGIEVCLWHDGAVTGALWTKLAGVPIRRPATPEAVDRARFAGRLMLGEVCLYTADQLGELYRAAEGAARRDGLPGTLRRLLRERRDRQARPALVWTLISTDARGKPTERMARLNRIQWPGLVVFDFCGTVGSARGRYRLFRIRRGVHLSADESCEDTGWAFRTLAEMWTYLESVKRGLRS